VAPLAGKIQAGVDTHDSPTRGELEGDCNLTTADLSQCSGVLPGHAHGLVSLFGKARVIQDQKTCRSELQASPHLQTVEELLLVPRALINELLERLLIVLGPLLDRLQTPSHGLNALSVAIEQQAAEVHVAPAPPPRMSERPDDIIQKCRQILPQLVERPCVHARDVGESRQIRPYQLNGVILTVR
jgi:hypothetical protein